MTSGRRPVRLCLERAGPTAPRRAVRPRGAQKSSRHIYVRREVAVTGSWRGGTESKPASRATQRLDEGPLSWVGVGQRQVRLLDGADVVEDRPTQDVGLPDCALGSEPEKCDGRNSLGSAPNHESYARILRFVTTGP